ncbi:MAG: phosphate ABC transporter permease PstA, partial [Bacteroidota bacterium]
MQSDFKKILSQSIAFWTFRILSLAVMGILFSIIGFILVKGIGVVSWDFITKMPEDGMTKGGIYPAIIGTLTLIAGSMLFAFPIGVMSGIYIFEFTKDNWYRKFVQLMTANLAGVPSIIFGLFGMALFVNKLEFGDSILAGSLTLGLLALPVVIRTTEEALKAIDNSYREASYALGATKLQTIKRVTLPMALPNIITGL